MKKILVVALALGAIVAPAAMAHGGKKHAPKPKYVEYAFKGVVASDATSTAVSLVNVRGLTKHARTALAGATTLNVTLTTGVTKIRGKHGKRLGFAALRTGDRVVVHYKALRGTAAAALPAARLVVDRGPLKGFVPPAPQPPVVATPPVEPPPVVVTPPPPPPAPPILIEL